MSNFHLKKTFNTPEVLLNYADGILLMEGRSIPEDPADFFEQIIRELKNYYDNARTLTKIEFKLDYINSGSSKWFLDIFTIIKNNHDKGHISEVLWYYDEEDEAILEMGQHFKNSFEIPFKLISY